MNFTKKSLVLQAVALCILLLAGSVSALGQGANGSILGEVTDSSGATVAGASVIITNNGTGAQQKATTGGSGQYQFPGLPAGSYKIETTAKGFKAEVRPSIDLTVGASLTVNLSLQLGNVSETIIVTDQAPQIETTSPTVSGLVGEHAIRELPLNGRDWLQLATLQAGVTGGLGQQATQGSPTNSRAARGNGDNLYINGNRPTENLYLADGLIINDYSNGSPGSALNINLGVDAVREFAVLTSGFSAQYGQTSGGVINAAFKSGTNDYHGTAFGFFRNSALDARNYFDGPTIPDFHRYQYGFAVGGPIKKDKIFFFGNFEGLNQLLGLSERSITLSNGARTGVVPNPNGPGTITVPIAPVIQPFLPLFPVANGSDNGDGTAFYNFSGAQTGDEYYAVGKVDFNLSPKAILSASYQWDTSSLLAPDVFNIKLVGSRASHDNGIVSLQNFLTPNLLNTAHVGVSYTFATDSEDVSSTSPLATDTTLGFVPGKPVGVITAGNVASAGGLGASGADLFHYISYQGSDDLNWIKGKNTLQFGFLFSRIADDFTSVQNPLGEWDYGSVQDLLQNVPLQFSSDLPTTNGARSLKTDYYGLYGQDVLRFNPRLTITAGLRYEYNTPVVEANGKVATLVNLTDPTQRLGGSFVGNANKLNFAPRVGVAYDVFGTGKTSLRASYGIYDILSLPYLFLNRTHAIPFFNSGVVNAPPASAFPANGLDLLSASASEGTYVQQNPARAYNQAWNLTVEQQLPSNFALMVGYVGSHSVHVPQNIDDMDQVPLSLVTIGANGQLHFPVPPGGNAKLVQRINPNFSRIEGLVYSDFSIYHGLLVNVSRRLSHGLALQGSYTYSKSIDQGSDTFSDNEYNNTVGPSYAFDLKLNKGVSDFNITNNFVVNGQWDIPVGELSGVPKAFLGGWQLGGIFQIHSGEPFSVRLTSDRAFTGNSRAHSSAGGQRPNYAGGSGCSVNPVNKGQPLNYINLSCFSFPAAGVLGNLGRNTLRGPEYIDVDTSLFKNIPLIHDRYSLQLRGEVFNIFNHTNFQADSPVIFTSTGGSLGSAGQLPAPTLTTSRQIQFGAKFIF